MLYRTSHRLLFLLAMITLPVFAQSLPEYDMRNSSMARDLEFPAEPTDIRTVNSPRMALHKPDGAGPFPAVVLLHTCGGLVGSAHMLTWANEAVRRGYVVMQVDSFSQRGVDKVCMGPKKHVFFSRGLRDAVQAAARLRELPYVDAKRVAFAGFSWGAVSGLLGSSAKSARALGLVDRFDALVSFYPLCEAYPKNGMLPYTLVLSEIDRPLLVLLGGKDNETPPGECTAGLQPKKDAGAPVELHLYPDATHCWDCHNLDGLKKKAFNGNTVEYVYNEAVTRDSSKRMFEFFEQSFARSR